VFVPEENSAITIKWPRFIGKDGKKLPFYKEKSLIGLTPDLIIINVWHKLLEF
jgi:hypothetical protein